MTNLLRPACVSLLLFTTCLALPACGNKGSLVRPPPAADGAWSDEAPPADELPPDTVPTEPDQPEEIQPPPAGGPPTDPVPAGTGDGDGDG